jgi:membrane protein implicated in regulation of membrane protease activity
MKRRVISALLMGIITTGSVSLTLVGVNRGYAPGFAGVWLRSWAISYVVVIPIILILSPVVQRFVRNLCKEEDRTYATHDA